MSHQRVAADIDAERGAVMQAELPGGRTREHDRPVRGQPSRERAAAVGHRPRTGPVRGEFGSAEGIDAQQLQRLIRNRHVAIDDRVGAHVMQLARKLHVQRLIDTVGAAIDLVGGRTLHRGQRQFESTPGAAGGDIDGDDGGNAEA